MFKNLYQIFLDYLSH